MEGGGGAAEALVWDNDVSAHAQTVAKAKYEFLFGLEEEKPSEMELMTVIKTKQSLRKTSRMADWSFSF